MRTSRFLIALLLGVAPTCFAQEPTWTPKCVANSPQAGYYAAMAYDSARGQSVLFGGDFSDFSPSNETWTWDGSIWMKQNPANSPPGRCCFGMAYDAARGQVVILGGSNASGFLNDTWVWDGVNWTQKASGPGPTLHMGLAYDPARQQVVFFGGGVFPNQLAETWVWDGTTWTKEFPATSPPPRSNFRLAYDAVHSEVLLFGGSNGFTLLNDTWVWDGTTWTQRSPTINPTVRQDYGLAYDTNRQRVVLFGGIQPPSVPVDDLTWLWDGSNWTTASPAASPPARGGDAMAYDAARDQIVLFGGVDSSQIFTDTWVLGGPTSTTCQPAITSISPTSGMQGQTIGNFTINGSNFDPAGILSFSGDAGIHVNSKTVTSAQITANISIGVFSATGPRDVVVMNPGGQTAVLNRAFTVVAAPPPPLPNISVSPTSLDFGTVPPGTTTQTVTISNTPNATGPLVVSNITSTNGAFKVFPSSLGPLAPQASATIAVSFTMPAGTPGTIDGVLTFTSNAPTISMPVKGTSVDRNPHSLIAIQVPFSGFPLDMEALNPQKHGNSISTYFTIKNLTGTWYEVTLDVQNSFPVPAKFTTPVSFTTQQIPGLPCFYSGTSIPCGFLIGPNETLTYPRNGQPLTFTPGQYLKLRATDLSFDQGLAFALDAFVRTLFGAQLTSKDLPASIFGTLSGQLVSTVCLQNAVDMLNDVNNVAKATADMFGLLSCVVKNDATMIANIGSWLSANPQLFGAGAGGLWTDVISKNLDGYAFLVDKGYNVAAYLTPLVYAQLVAPNTGYVLLGEPKP